jgi:colicin import membrane protein
MLELKSVNVVFAGCAATVVAGWLALLVMFAGHHAAPNASATPATTTANAAHKQSVPSTAQHGGTQGLAGPLANSTGNRAGNRPASDPGNRVGSRLQRAAMFSPTFTRARLSHTTGRGLFAGVGEANAHLILLRDRQAVATTRVSATGKWQIATAIRGATGSYEFSIEQSKSVDGGYTTGERISIIIPEGYQNTVDVTSNGPHTGFKLAAVRAASDDLGSAASRQFDSYFKTGPAPEGASMNVGNRALAARDDILAPAWKWLENANRSYHEEVVPRIKRHGYTTEADVRRPAKRPRAMRQADSRVAIRENSENRQGWGEGTISEGISSWFAAARRGYSTEIVPRLKGQLPAVIVARPRDDQDTVETEGERRAKEARRRRLEAAAVAKAERERQEAERRRKEALERRRTAELETRKLAAEERRAVERRAAAERKLSENERRRQEAERLAAAERERAAAAETARQAEERREREAQEEARRLAAEGASRKETDRQAAAEREARDEERRRQVELERQRELNRKREADSQRQREAAAAERRRQAALELRNKETAKEEARRRQAALQRQRELNQKLEEDRQRQREAAAATRENQRRLARLNTRRQPTATNRTSSRKRYVLRDTEIELDSSDRKPKVAAPRQTDTLRTRIKKYIFRDTVIEYGDNKSTEKQERAPTPERRRLALSPPKLPVRNQTQSRRSGSARDRLIKARNRPNARGREKKSRRSRRCHARAGRRISPPGTYVVRRGDSLWRISRRHYRLGKYFRTIQRANKGKIQIARLIYPCQRFHLPRKARR